VRGKPGITLKLDLIERLKDAPDTILTPPSDALPVNLAAVSLKQDAGFGWQLKTSALPYSEEARKRKIEGTVVIQATVGKNGRVHKRKPLAAHRSFVRPLSTMYAKGCTGHSE
jgi:Gram-negative bacterial TonB protein C-terminal